MKKASFLTILIVSCLVINTLPVLSIDNQVSTNTEPIKETLESSLYATSEKMENIPFVSQEKPDFLNMEKASAGNSPQENMIIVHIKKIRLLDETIKEPEYYLDIKINGNDPQWSNIGDTLTEKESWFNWPSIYNSQPYDENNLISIDIEIFLKNKFWFDTQADISPGSEKTLSLTYDPKRGDWSGDDYRGDSSGYGHASGFEDGIFNEKDFELWFEIYQLEVNNNQYLDGDKLTYWEETNLYNSDPFVNDGQIDFDNDGIPSEWEDQYGYDPFVWDDHENLDPDNDGLQNDEEYETDVWCSHPFIQDIFIEVDFMNGKYFWSKPYTFTEESAYLLTNAFAKKNIAMHVDLGLYGGGGDFAPYQERTEGMELDAARLKHFLNGNPNHWRRGIFHWAFICSRIEYWDREIGGRMFHTDSFVLARQTIIDNTFKYVYLKFSNPTVGMASVFMHELGHTLGLFSFGGIDNTDTTKPWKPGFWQYMAYESCMNYHYTYKLLDYSNGDDDSEFDQNDWAIINLARFEYQ
ncbi:MAG: hypothetical protein DRN27_06695 [Thermoplasmata archaeon]|nr:MAG: hypothetical protein DRN27_06695 [Thermoplasmata archaeon]